jgi:hypothetical protein
MENFEDRAMKFELKYCERCGGLWLRPKGSDLIFCFGCARAMAGLAPLWPRGPQVRSTRRAGDGMDGQGAFWGEGGNA